MGIPVEVGVKKNTKETLELARFNGDVRSVLHGEYQGKDVAVGQFAVHLWIKSHHCMRTEDRVALLRPAVEGMSAQELFGYPTFEMYDFLFGLPVRGSDTILSQGLRTWAVRRAQEQTWSSRINQASTAYQVATLAKQLVAHSKLPGMLTQSPSNKHGARTKKKGRVTGVDARLHRELMRCSMHSAATMSAAVAACVLADATGYNPAATASSNVSKLLNWDGSDAAAGESSFMRWSRQQHAAIFRAFARHHSARSFAKTVASRPAIGAYTCTHPSVMQGFGATLNYGSRRQTSSASSSTPALRYTDTLVHED